MTFLDPVVTLLLPCDPFSFWEGLGEGRSYLKPKKEIRREASAPRNTRLLSSYYVL